MNTKIIKFVIACVLFGGVVDAVADNAVRVAISYDKYAKATGIATENYSVPDVGKYFSAAFADAALRGRVTDDGKESVELYVTYHGHGWRFFGSVTDIDGEPLPFNEYDRQTIYGDEIAEQFSASLTRKYLEDRQSSGLDMRFDGKYGTLVVKLPASYVQSFLTSLGNLEQTTREKIATKAVAGAPNKIKLGVSYVAVNEKIAAAFKLANPSGVLVTVVVPGSAADKAGIQKGDILLTVNKNPIESSLSGLQERMSSIEAGQEVMFSIWRNGAEEVVKAQF